MKTKTKCPQCDQVNEFADEDVAVDGPREYHARCWSSITEVIDYVESHDDDHDHDDDELARLFEVAYCRCPDSVDRSEGLWSHLCVFSSNFNYGE